MVTRGTAQASAQRAAAQHVVLEADRGWRFDRHLSINTIINILGIALVLGLPLFYWARAMDTRVSVLEIAKVERERSEATREADVREQRSGLAGRLDKMDDKLTQLQVQVGQLIVQLNLRDKTSK